VSKCSAYINTVMPKETTYSEHDLIVLVLSKKNWSFFPWLIIKFQLGFSRWVHDSQITEKKYTTWEIKNLRKPVKTFSWVLVIVSCKTKFCIEMCWSASFILSHISNISWNVAHLRVCWNFRERLSTWCTQYNLLQKKQVTSELIMYHIYRNR
jgi:hypothetical protein